MGFIVGCCVGFVAGWLFLKRPQWMTDLFQRIKEMVS